MGEDIRLATGVRSHRKMKRLRRALGGAACFSLLCLWCFAGEERPDGDLSGLTDADIAEEADWSGSPTEFVDTLVAFGWLDGEPGAYRLHDWAEHQPWVVNRPARIRAAQVAANARWGNGSTKPRNARRMRGACAPDADRNAPYSTQKQVTPESTSRGTRVRAAPAPAEPEFALQGAFEGHAEVSREATPNPVAPFAVALNRAGHKVTSLNPELIAYVGEGGTLQELLSVAAHPDCAGKPGSYVVKFARRELASRASAVLPSINRSNGGPSKSLEAVTRLANLRGATHATPTDASVDDRRRLDRTDQAVLPVAGKSTGG